MNKPLSLLLGILLPAGMVFSQVPEEYFEQLEKELFEREFHGMELSEPFEREMPAGKPGASLKSGMADIGNAPDWNWVRSFTGQGGAPFRDIVVDASKNVYAYGTFSDSIEILGTTLVSTGIRDVFILKISSFGTLSWLISLEALPGENIYANSMALSKGGIVITGYLGTETISGVGKSVTRTEGEDRFMAHVSSGGTVDWINLYSDLRADKMLCDENDNIYCLSAGNLQKFDLKK